MFHEMPLKLCFMKCSERKISQCILTLRFTFIIVLRFITIYHNMVFIWLFMVISNFDKGTLKKIPQNFVELSKFDRKILNVFTLRFLQFFEKHCEKIP